MCSALSKIGCQADFVYKLNDFSWDIGKMFSFESDKLLAFHHFSIGKCGSSITNTRGTGVFDFPVRDPAIIIR